MTAYCDQSYQSSQLDIAPYLFRTFYTPERLPDRDRSKARRGEVRNFGEPSAIPIWQVGRATSAAPTYFRFMEMELEGKRVRFKDGGFGTNNPSFEAYEDIREKHGGATPIIGPFISIGTGGKPASRFSKRRGNLSDALASLKGATGDVSETQRVHDMMSRVSRTDNDEEVFPYYRFQIDQSLGNIGLDEWKSYRFARRRNKSSASGAQTLDKIETVVNNFLDNDEVKKDLDACAKILVKRRRLRIRDPVRWHRYATLSSHKCNLKGCEKMPINDADDFQSHLKRKHHLNEEEIKEKVNECMFYEWTYRSNHQTA